MSAFKRYFLRTKIAYTGIFFFVYMLYRTFGCPTIDYLCGQELEYFVPIFFIIIYYFSVSIFVLTLSSIKPLKTIKNAIIDFFAENSFYITSIMLINEERYDPYFGTRTSIIILSNLLYTFWVFRKGFTLRYNFAEYENKKMSNLMSWIIALIFSIIFYYAFVFFFKSLLISFGLIDH
jgi:hypothetical protein